ncbi:hypothetical protein CGG97_20250 [Vibrio parahaemolyticus]|nr:hypothetical protein CGG97_20250 [Vibrio parahaemolyticus]
MCWTSSYNLLIPTLASLLCCTDLISLGHQDSSPESSLLEPLNLALKRYINFTHQQCSLGLYRREIILLTKPSILNYLGII